MRASLLDAARHMQAGVGSPVVVTLTGGAKLAARLWRGWLRFEGSGCIEAATRHAFEPVRQRSARAPGGPAATPHASSCSASPLRPFHRARRVGRGLCPPQPETPNDPP